MKSEPVWIVDDDSSIRWVLQKALDSANIGCVTFENPADVLTQLDAGLFPEVIVSDIRMPQISGMEVMAMIHQRQPDLPVIIMTAHSDLDSAVSAYQGGAFEYLPKPFDIDEAVTLIQRALTHSREASRQKKSIQHSQDSEIIGEAPAMQEVFRAIGRLSRSSISVLISGESGTGKELVAGALHKHSPRSDNTFVAINMAAIPTELIESELFGHEKGAFTGAQNARQGRFEQANGGTLFLDEIGDMPINIQTRLLRVLADGQFYRVGGHQPVSVDVRIIAATHQNLEKRVEEGQFREDLYHRLNVIKIHIPSLRDRREDIPLLTQYFMQHAADELEVEPKSLHKDTQKVLNQLTWPGNVRQLENICRWLTVMASGKEVLPEDLPEEINQSSVSKVEKTANESWQSLLSHWADSELQSGRQGILDEAQPVFERIMLQRALHFTDGHKQEAARLLGWGRNTLTRKLKELDM